MTLTPQTLSSQRIDIAGTIDDAIELCFERGWTDGLPVVPPTEAKVLAFLELAGLEPSHIIGVEPVRGRVITAEKVAINALMAGCRPEYMPVVVATVEAMVQHEYNLYSASGSTAGTAPLMIINGPIRKRLGFNSGHNLFAGGPQFRANATIGRAIRLILINVLETHPGVLDRSTLGHGGKYSFCFAEDEEGSAWEPLHVERGFPPDSSTVTVGSCLAPLQLLNCRFATVEGQLTSVADSMMVMGSGNAELILVVPTEPMDFVKEAGWSKAQVRGFLFHKAQRTAQEWFDTNKEWDKRDPPAPGAEDALVPVLTRPESLLIVAGGGAGAPWSALIPRYSKGLLGDTVTREIDTSRIL